MLSISVVIPVYNTAKYIEACIQSLLNQTMSSDGYEIIMVDNNSTDGSADIIKRSPTIRLLQEPRQGAYVSRNTGIKNSRSDILAFTDSDSTVGPDWLCQIHETLASDDTDIAMGFVGVPETSPALSKLNAYRHARNTYIFGSNITDLYFGFGGNMAVKKSAFDKIGLFDESECGSDSLLNQKYVRHFSPRGIVYNARMRTVHLEAGSLGVILRKQMNYGRTGREHRKSDGRRWLNKSESQDVFRRTVEAQNYTWFEARMLALILALIRVFSRMGAVEGSITGRGLDRE